MGKSRIESPYSLKRHSMRSAPFLVIKPIEIWAFLLPKIHTLMLRNGVLFNMSELTC